MVAPPAALGGVTTRPTHPTAATGTGLSDTKGFLSTIHHALAGVSAAQSAASHAEKAVAEGKPGASMATALVLSDRAQLGFSATVSARNEVVSAYQSLMSMQI